jgi:hypothetical protein
VCETNAEYRRYSGDFGGGYVVCLRYNLNLGVYDLVDMLSDIEMYGRETNSYECVAKRNRISNIASLI